MLGAIALFCLVVGLLLASRRLLGWAGEFRWSIAGALAACWLLAGTALLTPLLGNLVLATCATALPALATLAIRKRVGVDEFFREGLHPAALVFAVLAIVLASWAALKGYFWDESLLHFGLTGIIARGVVPPLHPAYPDETFAYHYGCDLIAGIIRAFTGAPVHRAIDATTIACFLLLTANVASLGRALGGKVGAGLAIVLVPFGSSLLQYPLFGDMGPLSLAWIPFPETWRRSMPPPIISNFFQHAQGLGMPLAIAVILLFTSTGTEDEHRRRSLLGAAMLGVLSLAQAIFFLVLGVALGVVALFRFWQRRATAPSRENKVALGLDLGLLCGALAIAVALGGFFAPDAPRQELLFQPYFPDAFVGNVAHHAVVFGLPLLALPWYVRRFRQTRDALRLALVAAVFVGFTIPNCICYKSGWDIVKFFGVAGFFANALLADLLTHLWSEARFAWRRALVVGALVTSVPTSFVWLARMSVLDGRWGVPPMQFKPPSPIAQALFDKLEPVVGPRDRVFSINKDLSMVGFVTPGFSFNECGGFVFMMDEERVSRLETHRNAVRKELRMSSLRALKVGWLILSPRDLNALPRYRQRLLEDTAKFQHFADVNAGGETRHVFKILPPPPVTLR